MGSRLVGGRIGVVRQAVDTVIILRYINCPPSSSCGSWRSFLIRRGAEGAINKF